MMLIDDIVAADIITTPTAISFWDTFHWAESTSLWFLFSNTTDVGPIIIVTIVSIIV